MLYVGLFTVVPVYLYARSMIELVLYFHTSTIFKCYSYYETNASCTRFSIKSFDKDV